MTRQELEIALQKVDQMDIDGMTQRYKQAYTNYAHALRVLIAFSKEDGIMSEEAA